MKSLRDEILPTARFGDLHKQTAKRRAFLPEGGLRAFSCAASLSHSDSVTLEVGESSGSHPPLRGPSSLAGASQSVIHFLVFFIVKMHKDVWLLFTKIDFRYKMAFLFFFSVI